MINGIVKKEFLVVIIPFLLQIGIMNSTLWAQTESGIQKPKGNTHGFAVERDLIEVGVAPVYVPPAIQENQKLYKTSRINATLSESKKLDLYIPADKHFAVKFDNLSQSLDFIYPEQDIPFSLNVQSAIDKSPDWMKNDLELIFSQLSSQYQEKWAKAILDAEDPYIDEIAFSIAHLSPQYLMSLYAYTELITLNAKLIYEYDPHLEYVDVVDYGLSATDPNYYSTTKYRKANFIDTIEVEVPRDIYYWYIVHPRITDEIPAFIDPEIAEYTHKENITLPDNGYFWREYLFNHVDPGYALFKDMIKGCKVVWNKYGENLGGTNALDVMNRWLNGSIIFTSENDRPHQPVRIYRKHMGRCGEFGDMRVALARTALIPCANVATYSRDHVWNEFWDERWIHWDGYIDAPYMYIDDWHKELNSVFRWRSDGLFTSVTQTYTRKYATLNIYALDSLSNPIDGARIILYAPGEYESIAFDNYGITDMEGKVTFIIGADRTYWANMWCDYGSVPSDGGVLRVVSSSQHDETYFVSLVIDACKPTLTWEDIPVPQIADKEFLLELDVSIPSQIIRSRGVFDDLENALQYISWPQGKLNFFIADKINYDKYLANQEFQGFYSSHDSLNRLINFEFGNDSDWYCVFDNSNALNTLQYIRGAVNLYKMYDESIPHVQIQQNFPNPLVPQSGRTTIIYRLPEKTKVELAIYNVLGQKVKTLIREDKYAGEFEIQWDGKNDLDQTVASGIYFCKINTARGTASRRIVVMQ